MADKSVGISILAPRGGSDLYFCFSSEDSWEFQSSLPAGGATQRSYSFRWLDPHFNPRSPRGERRGANCTKPLMMRFQSSLPAGGATLAAFHLSTLAEGFQSSLPAGGATCGLVISIASPPQFQSSLPAGGATLPFRAYSLVINISILAPRGGSDLCQVCLCVLCLQISILAPRGGSDFLFRAISTTQNNFNPRSPRGERHGMTGGKMCPFQISILAPRGGSDPAALCWNICNNHFNPRSPRGERRDFGRRFAKQLFISILAPRGGSDGRCRLPAEQ